MQLLFPFGERGAQRRGEAFAIRKTIHNNIDIKKLFTTILTLKKFMVYFMQIYLDKTRKNLKDVI